MGQKTIGQLYADHPVSSLGFTDLIEVEQGGLSKGSTLEKIALAGIINPLNAQINVNTTYTITNSPAIYTVIIPKAYLLTTTTATVLLTITTGVGGKENVVIPISGSGDTITSNSLVFDIYVDSSGNVSSKQWTISGSNSNGSYIKFADGTMICSYYSSATIAQTVSQDNAFPYPVQFLTLLGLSGSAQPVVSWIGVSITAISYYAGVYGSLVGCNIHCNSTTGQNFNDFTFIARGTWK